jgi:hypothetical protein
LAEEGMDLADPPGHGRCRRVGKVGLEGAPDALDRVVMGAVARPVQHDQLGWAASQRCTILEWWMMTLSQTTATCGAVG